MSDNLPSFQVDFAPNGEESSHIEPVFIPMDTTPSTPGEKSDEEGFIFTRRRAMASFENLVAMANHQERLKEARKMVWRDRGEPVVELHDLETCLAHAMSGGFSTYPFLYSEATNSSFSPAQGLPHWHSTFVPVSIWC